MEYRLYHDESKEKGYWHGMLLVPEHKRIELYGRLCAISAAHSITQAISLKAVKSTTGSMARAAERWVGLGVCALSSDHKGKVMSYSLRLNRTEELSTPIGAKFIVFHKADDHGDMTGRMNWTEAVETTCRMGLKGGLHALASEMNPVHITGMHFDGHKHYGRRLDRFRLVERLRPELRPYCTIAQYSDIIVDKSSNPTDIDAQDLVDCTLLQLTDLLVGSVRSVAGSGVHNRHKHIVKPVADLLGRYNSHPARWMKSRWSGGLWVRSAALENGAWAFSEVHPQRPVVDEGEQICLQL